MKQILLYYPTMSIPNYDWVRNSILYTDGVSSILPPELSVGDLNDEFMNILEGEGEYVPTNLFDHITAGSLREKKFSAEFINVIKSDTFKNLQNIDTPFDPGNYFDLYTSKLTKDVHDYLQESGLVGQHTDEKISVEKKAAIIYMSMVSDVVADNGGINWIVPSTDNPTFEQICFQVSNEYQTAFRLDFQNCLPSPMPATNIRDIINFKRKNKLLLDSFRIVYADLEKELRSAEEDNERKAILIKFQATVVSNIVKIGKEMGKSKIESYLNSFSSLLNIKAPEVVGTATALGLIGAGAATAISLPIGIGLGTIVLLGTAIGSHRKRMSEIESNAFSYLYYAKKEGIVRL